MVRTLTKHFLPAILVSSLLASPLAAEIIDKTASIGGMTMRYRVVQPGNYDPAKAYPAVLAFPPGGQDMSMVNATLLGNYRAQAEKRG
jgi:hypothetical protein